MKIEKSTTTYPLSACSIDTVSENTGIFLEQIGMERRNILRMKLTLENILLNWREHYGENTEFRFETGTRFKRPYINLSLEGEAFDPTDTEDDFSDVSARLLAGLGLYPTYSHSKNVNTVSVKLKKRPANPVAVLLLAMAAAIVLGSLGLLLPEGVRTAGHDYLLTPLYDTLIGLLSTVAGPMIFLSVAWGIYGMGDASMLGRIGKKMLVRFAAMTFFFSAFALLVLLPVVKLNFASAGIDTAGLLSILELLLNIFPHNIISPFLEGNTMQIILIATAVGCIMLVLGSQTKLVAGLIEQANSIIRYLIEIIGNIIPFFIFIIIVKLIWSGSLHEITTLWKPFAAFVVISAVSSAMVLLYVSLKGKVSVFVLMKKLFPAFFIAFTTASSAAAFGTVAVTCERDLGINSKINNFSVPLSMVLYKPMSAVNFMVFAVFFTKQYALDVSVLWLISTVLVVTILAIALPPIPGGAFTCFAILFTQLGIPAEALGIVMVMNVFVDFICTGLDTVLRQCELVLAVDKVKMLDRSILQKKKK